MLTKVALRCELVLELGATHPDAFPPSQSGFMKLFGLRKQPKAVDSWQRGGGSGAG